MKSAEASILTHSAAQIRAALEGDPPGSGYMAGAAVRTKPGPPPCIVLEDLTEDPLKINKTVEGQTVQHLIRCYALDKKGAATLKDAVLEGLTEEPGESAFLAGLVETGFHIKTIDVGRVEPDDRITENRTVYGYAVPLTYTIHYHKPEAA